MRAQGERTGLVGMNQVGGESGREEQSENVGREKVRYWTERENCRHFSVVVGKWTAYGVSVLTFRTQDEESGKWTNKVVNGREECRQPPLPS